MPDTHQPSSDTERQEEELRWEKYKEEREARETEEKRQAAENAQPTPETVAAKYADSAHRSSIDPIPNTEHGSIARAPAPVGSREPSNLTPDEKAEYESPRPTQAPVGRAAAPTPDQLARGRELLALGRKPVKDVIRTPEETMRANLEAPGHQIGAVIEGPVDGTAGLFECRVDALGRVWRF